jgi:hypothetical protein
VDSAGGGWAAWIALATSAPNTKINAA